MLTYCTYCIFPFRPVNKEWLNWIEDNSISYCNRTSKWMPQRCFINLYSLIFYLIVTYLAKGEQCAPRGLSKFIVPDSRTLQPGKNLRLLGFGVSCVCTNMDLPGRIESPKSCNITLHWVFHSQSVTRMLMVYKPGITQWGFCVHLLQTPVLCEGQSNPVLWYPLPGRLKQQIREIGLLILWVVRTLY